MNLPRAEFDSRYAEQSLRIAFIGMSNIGKSYTATRLCKTHDFDLIEVDRLIWAGLKQGSMADFARWQGQPYSEGYEAREAVSVKLESTAMKTAMMKSAGIKRGGNSLLDTTGSVIYSEEAVLKQLSAEYLIVHITAADKDLARLQADYFALPKPLVWHGHYQKIDGKSEQESIVASYPKLLQSRKSAYAALADISLSSAFVLDKTTTMDAVFEAIRTQLR